LKKAADIAIKSIIKFKYVFYLCGYVCRGVLFTGSMIGSTVISGAYLLNAGIKRVREMQGFQKESREIRNKGKEIMDVQEGKLNLPIPVNISGLPEVNLEGRGLEIALIDIREWIRVEGSKFYISDMGRQVIIEQLERANLAKEANREVYISLLFDFEGFGVEMSVSEKRAMMKDILLKVDSSALWTKTVNDYIREELLFDVQGLPDNALSVGVKLKDFEDSMGREIGKVMVLTGSSPEFIDWWKEASDLLGWPLVAIRLLDVGVDLELMSADENWIKHFLSTKYQYSEKQIDEMLEAFRKDGKIVIKGMKINKDFIDTLKDESFVYDMQA